MAQTTNGGAAVSRRLGLRIWKHRAYYVLMLPAIIYVLIFCYAPMYGLQIAFKNYKGALGIAGSKWCGMKHFMSFFNSYNFTLLMRNTIVLSLYSLIAGFPMPIIIALLLNETKGMFKRASQTILYAPHFLSTVVVVGMINTMLSPSFGVVNTIIEALGGERIYFMTMPGAFRHLYVWSGVWQGMGWGAIIYLAALAAVDPELHEAATIDGATRLQRIRYINLPTIVPTIIILLIMRMGSLVSVGYEKVYLLQNDLNVEVSEVISTYVYKRGLLQNNYSFSTAVGLFNNVVNIALLLITNFITRRVSDTSLF